MKEDFRSLIEAQIKQKVISKGNNKEDNVKENSEPEVVNVSKQKNVNKKQSDKIDINKDSVKQELSPFKASNLMEFFSAIGYNVDITKLEDAMKTLKKQTVYGETDLIIYESLIKAKVYEYIKFGVAKRVWDMLEEQAERRKVAGKSIKDADLLLILLEMARMEVEYGLRPIIHVIPVENQIYVKADGFLYYGKASGNLKSIKWEDQEKNGVWYSKCIVETVNGTYEGIASATPNPRVYTDDPREKARTKAMRRALRRAFPIGAGEEIYDEFDNSPINDGKVAENLKELLNLVGNFDKKVEENVQDDNSNNTLLNLKEGGENNEGN